MKPFALFLLLYSGLWNQQAELRLIHELNGIAFTTIRCPKEKGGCGKYENKAVFASRKTCPHCKTRLRVRVPNRRNAPVSAFTEKFARDALQSAIDRNYKDKLFVVRGVTCKGLSLTGGSAADLAVLRGRAVKEARAEDVAIVIEVKMSIIWNWRPDSETPIADYDHHGGRPSLYRTDSLLKAIGKAAVFRATPASSHIPYLVVGNCPPPKGYYDKVDGAYRSGMVQRFLSLTANPLTDPRDATKRNPKQTPGGGFLRIDSIDELAEMLKNVIDKNWVHLGGMVDRKELGEAIKSLDLTRPPEEVADQFLRAIRAD